VVHMPRDSRGRLKSAPGAGDLPCVWQLLNGKINRQKGLDHFHIGATMVRDHISCEPAALGQKQHTATTGLPEICRPLRRC